MAYRATHAGSTSPFCNDGRVHINFVTDASALLGLSNNERPVLDGVEFRLPTPTLVGLPVDTAGYEALLRGYGEQILPVIQQATSAPIDLPSQHLAALCYSTSENSLDLVDYSPQDGLWSTSNTERDYRYLRPTPEDDGLILRAGYPGQDLDRLQLTLERDGHEQQLLDVGRAELTASFAAFGGNATGDDLVLRFGQGSTGIADYAVVPLSSCTGTESCMMRNIEGYPLWAPGGETTIISDVGQLLIGDSEVQSQSSLGPGFSPFWLRSTVFGFVALANNGESSNMQVVIQDLETGQQKIVIDSTELMAEIRPEQGGRLRIRYVTVNPADPSLLLIGGSPAGSEVADYFVFGIRLLGSLDSVVDLEVAKPEMLLHLPGIPEGDPATYTPTGSPAFTFSSDGRWLMTVRFVDRIFNTWELNLVELASGETKTITTNYPPYPAQYPYFDWSADGQWLALMDEGYLRLIAPAHNYEQIVPYDFRNCTYSGWINP